MEQYSKDQPLWTVVDIPPGSQGTVVRGLTYGEAGQYYSQRHPAYLVTKKVAVDDVGEVRDLGEFSSDFLREHGVPYHYRLNKLRTGRGAYYAEPPPRGVLYILGPGIEDWADKIRKDEDFKWPRLEKNFVSEQWLSELRTILKARAQLAEAKHYAIEEIEKHLDKIEKKGIPVIAYKASDEEDRKRKKSLCERIFG